MKRVQSIDIGVLVFCWLSYMPLIIVFVLFQCLRPARATTMISYLPELLLVLELRLGSHIAHLALAEAHHLVRSVLATNTHT